MLSRLFWIFLAGAAVVAEAAMDGRSWLFGWGDHSAGSERVVETRMDREIDRKLDRMQIVDSRGREVRVGHQAERELGEAVRRLVTAETDFALARIRDSSETATARAQARRDKARAEVERLKDEIGRDEAMSSSDRDAMRDQIRQQVRETVRSAVRG